MGITVLDHLVYDRGATDVSTSIPKQNYNIIVHLLHFFCKKATYFSSINPSSLKLKYRLRPMIK